MRPSALRDINRRLWDVSLVLAYVGLSFVLNPASAFWSGQFNDSDDYMRMARVFDLLRGQNWYDLSQHRLSPGDHFILPWSRLIDAPLALATLLFAPLVGMDAAGGMAAFLAPLFWLGTACFFLPLMGRGLLPRRRAWLLLAAALGSFALLREWLPMRVDHHGAQLCLALICFVMLQLYVLQPRPWRLLACGGLAAMGLAVGAESWLWTALTTGYVALHAVWSGGRAPRQAPAFGLALALGIVLALPVLRPPQDWLMHDMALPAWPHLVFAMLTMLVLGALRLLPATMPRVWRLGVLAALALAAAGIFLALMPELRGGIYAANMSDSNRGQVLGSVIEAKSYLQRLSAMQWTPADMARYWPLAAHNLILPLLACLALLMQFLRHRRDRQFGLWALQVWFFLPVALGALFWQSRLGIYLALYALPSLAWLLAQGLRVCAGLPWRGLRLPAQGLALSLVFLPVMSAHYYQGARPMQLLLFPSWTVPKPCDWKQAAMALNDKRLFGATPINVVTGLAGGTELLYRTPHRVFSAPYDVTGNDLARRFFGMRDPGGARMMARMHQIGAVLVCDNYAGAYLPDERARQAARGAADALAHGQPVPPEMNAVRVLVDHLVQGDTPDWLQSVPLPAMNLHLYRVAPP